MAKLIDQLIFEEGVRLNAYICPAGYLTIGIGHNLVACPRFNGVPIPHSITDVQATELLLYDIATTTEQLRKRWPHLDNLDKCRQDACIAMAFQLGINGFLGFDDMISALERENWLEAKRAALASKWAHKDSPARAKRVAKQLATGEYYQVPKYQRS